MLCLLLASAILFFQGSCREKATFEIPEGYVGMFGYGSLMSKNFIETGLLGGKYEGPFLPAHLSGYKRSWTFAWPADIPSATPHGHYYKAGVLYSVPESDLPVYDAWEPGYERFEVTDRVAGFEIKGGPVYPYRALPSFESEPTGDIARNVIERDYLQIVRDAFDDWGEAFEEEYRQSSEPPDAGIFREIQKIPWENPPLEKVEALMHQFEYRDLRKKRNPKRNLP